jgi:hypothetical protein
MQLPKICLSTSSLEISVSSFGGCEEASSAFEGEEEGDSDIAA